MKKKKKVTVIHEKRDLDWYMKFFKPVCKCGNQMSVHAHRRKTKGRDEVIYASCLNKECDNYHQETAFTPQMEVVEVRERRKTNEAPGCSADSYYRHSDNCNSYLGDIGG